MFAESTISVLCAIVKSDKNASRLEKSRLTRAITQATEENLKCIDRVVSFADASRILGFRNPQTARRMAKSGKLKSVFGTGTKRPVGVSMSSIQNVMATGCKN